MCTSQSTTDNLAVTLAKVTKSFKAAQETTSEIQTAIQEEGGGPWQGFPHLTQELLQESLEDLQDPHRELLRRLEARAREIERLTGVNGEDPERRT